VFELIIVARFSAALRIK